jgi:hypothetical protein
MVLNYSFPEIAGPPALAIVDDAPLDCLRARWATALLDDGFHETSVMELMIGCRIPCFAIGKTRSGIMAGWRVIASNKGASF